MKTRLFFLLVLILATVSIWQSASEHFDWQIINDTAGSVANEEPTFSRSFVFKKEAVSSVHASAITAVADGELLAVWYGGSREGSRDVAIYGSRKIRSSEWTQPSRMISRTELARDTGRHIKKLGNPVLLSDGENNVWMFFVSTSIGGWSTSSINLVISRDGGRTWSKARRLISSPFINISTLVKGRPFFYRDGSIGLPAYHELAGKFAELIRVSRDGRVIGKARIAHGRYTIQPSIVTFENNHLIAMMRNTDSIRDIVRAYSQNGGRTWSSTVYTDLPNPDAAISMAGNEQFLVLVYNDIKWGRHQLSIAVSTDKGLNWKKRFQLESSGPGADGSKAEFSYPYLFRDKQGEFHLVYTWQRRRIAYVNFNRSWLEQLP